MRMEGRYKLAFIPLRSRMGVQSDLSVRMPRLRRRCGRNAPHREGRVPLRPTAARVAFLDNEATSICEQDRFCLGWRRPA